MKIFSPFDLSGPEFLVFYLALGTWVLLGLYLVRHWGEASDPPQVNLSDPHLIAFLRGGQNEVLRVATVSLIDRGLLEVSGTQISSVRNQSAAALRIPIEKRLLAHFGAPSEASSLFKPDVFAHEMVVYESELARLDLIPSERTKWAQNSRLGIAILVLWGVALIKIFVAVARGRSNVWFLIILAIAFGFGSERLARPRLTRRGIAMLSSLRTLFGGLKGRAPLLRPGESADEVLLLAAVFGVEAIPARIFPNVHALFPRGSSSPAGLRESSCGAACGGGCGGGGCGGGCGGCGS
ncbi:MAG TPA: TIGR04222 domain-containing membrane protein [Bryobacteraceae bacterium]|nr:TIGR04222 domain-containing membrane protein [Bryobacteraceae bacterium]